MIITTQHNQLILMEQSHS